MTTTTNTPPRDPSKIHEWIQSQVDAGMADWAKQQAEEQKVQEKVHEHQAQAQAAAEERAERIRQAGDEAVEAYRERKANPTEADLARERIKYLGEAVSQARQLQHRRGHDPNKKFAERVVEGVMGTITTYLIARIEADMEAAQEELDELVAREQAEEKARRDIEREEQRARDKAERDAEYQRRQEEQERRYKERQAEQERKWAERRGAARPQTKGARPSNPSPKSDVSLSQQPPDEKTQAILDKQERREAEREGDDGLTFA